VGELCGESHAAIVRRGAVIGKEKGVAVSRDALFPGAAWLQAASLHLD